MKQETKMPDGSLLVEHYKTTRRGTQYLASDILVSPDETKTLKHYYDVRGNLKREVIQADGIVTECKYDERGHRISRHTRTSDGARRKALATKEAGGIAAKAPAVITNAVPGQPSRLSFDPLTGQQFSSRGDYESYLEKHDLVEVDVGSLPVPPSEAECPKRPDDAYVGTHGTLIVGGSTDKAFEIARERRQQLINGTLPNWAQTRDAEKRRDYKRRERIKVQKGNGFS